MAGNSSERLEDLQYKREQARLGGGLKRQEAIRASGRGTARDRVRMLLDEDSFIELDSFVTQARDHDGEEGAARGAHAGDDPEDA